MTASSAPRTLITHRAPNDRTARRRSGRRAVKAAARRWSCVLLLAYLVTNAAAVVVVVRAAAQSFDDYHHRVDQAIEAVDELLEESDEDLAAIDSASPTSRTFARIREAMTPAPADNQVEWDETLIVADNAWLEAALSDYEQNSAARPASENRAALRAVDARLHAIDGRILLAQKADGAQIKADHARLDSVLERLRRGREEEAANKDTALARLSKRIRDYLAKFLDWLRELAPRAPRVEPIDAGGGGGTLLPTLAQILVYALILGLLALLAWKFGPTLLARWRQRKRPAVKRAARVVLGERIEADQSSTELFAEAEALARRGETRQAIRQAYVALLCELGDRRLLRLEQQKTNRDYLTALAKRPALYAEVSPLTDNYERCWYGTSVANSQDWEVFRQRCRQALALPEIA